MTTELIPPNHIRTDGGTQPRAKIDPAVYEEYAERMTAGDHFDPITVYFDGEAYWLADGFHRLKAHLLAWDEKPVECEVFQGTRDGAQWHSYSANISHGLRRTNEDKARAVRAALMHPKGKDLSDGQIAEHVGVSDRMVAKYRETTPKVSESTVRAGKDGRTINTAKIGKNLKDNCRGCDQPKPPRELTDPCDRPSNVAHATARHRDTLLPTASDLNRRNARHGCRVRLELPTNHVHNCAFDLLRHLPFDYLQEVFTEVVRIHQERSEKETHS